MPSGLAPFAAEGITILTDDNNKFFVDASLGSPRTLVGDALAKSHKKPKVEGVIDKMVLGDDTRTIELHHVKDLEHSDGMLIAYLPKEKILFTADFNVPAPGQPVSPSIATLRPEHRSAAARFRTARDGPRAQPGSADDQGRSAGAGQREPTKVNDVDNVDGEARMSNTGRRTLVILLASSSAPASRRSRLRCWRTTRSQSTYLEADTIEVEGNVSSSSSRTRTRGFTSPARRPSARSRPTRPSGPARPASTATASTKRRIHVGDIVRIWVSPNRDPNDNRVRLKRIERRSDGWKWGAGRGDTR